MSPKRKSLSGIGKGYNAFFEETEESPTAQQPPAPQSATETPPASEELERATFYIRPDQHDILERLKIELRKVDTHKGGKIKTNKSELVREAIDLLGEQDLEMLAERLNNNQS